MSPGGPLLFVFHGTGGDENQFVGARARPAAGRDASSSPRGDVSEHGAARFFRRTGEGVYDMADLARAHRRRWRPSSRRMSRRRKPSRVVGLGYSNGANILASMLFARPDLFDAAVLMHPLIPFEPEVDGGLDGHGAS